MKKFNPGDLAKVISNNPEYSGRIVEIIREAPDSPFDLPDGYEQGRPQNASQGKWVIRFFGDPVRAPLKIGVRESIYGVGDETHMEKIGDVNAIVMNWAAENAD